MNGKHEEPVPVVVVGITPMHYDVFPFVLPGTSAAGNDSATTTPVDNPALSAGPPPAAHPQPLQQHEMDTCTNISVDCPRCQETFLLSEIWHPDMTKAAFMKEVLASDATVNHYTGFSSLPMLRATFDWLKPSAEYIRLWNGKGTAQGADAKVRRRRNQSLFDEFLLTLIRLRRGYDNEMLSSMFAMSASQASKIFLSWVCYLDQVLAPLIQYPSKEMVADNLPDCFEAFPNTRVILDCFEIQIQKPKRPAAQRQTWSNYKHNNTIKVLVGIMPSGAITFVSDSYAGSISDVEIVKESGLLRLIERGDDVMADRGFTIRHLLLALGATLNIPAFTHGNPLNPKALLKSRRIASVRIHVERAIGRVKKFAILDGPMHISLRYVVSKIVRICCVMCNLQGRLAE